MSRQPIFAAPDCVKLRHVTTVVDPSSLRSPKFCETDTAYIAAMQAKCPYLAVLLAARMVEPQIVDTDRLGSLVVVRKAKELLSYPLDAVDDASVAAATAPH